MIKLKVTDLAEQLKLQLQELLDQKSPLYRKVVLDLIPMVHERIHVKGLAANGQRIGNYTNAYMKVRTGQYGNSDKFKKGKKAGLVKNSGTFSRGAKKGQQRPKYNRSTDPKVILSLTRQMENDYAVLETDTGWGIGFNNELNADKARYNDKRYPSGEIYNLSQEEQTYGAERTEALITEQFNR